jgi:hypothetical protein
MLRSVVMQWLWWLVMMVAADHAYALRADPPLA